MPLVSAIVPMYGVEKFLPDCLQSLRNQTLQDVEYVLVDDGSPDGGARIAAEYVKADSRFTYVYQSNRGPGPGGGRNGGLSSASGEYLIFVDGDDVVAPDGFERMVDAARASDADLVTCNTVRLVGGAVRVSEFHDLSHPCDVAATTLAESPWLTFDPTPWNKLFRRSFFDEVVVEWPERVLYEDIYAMTKAHLCSARTAVIADAFYYWRIRAGGGSITQSSHTIRGDLAQLRELRRAAELLRTEGSPEMLEWFSWKAYCFDLHWMTRKIVTLDNEATHTLRQAMVETMHSLDQRVAAYLPSPVRSVYELLSSFGPFQLRQRIRVAQPGLAAVNRSLEIAKSQADPGAVLLKWHSQSGSATVSVAVENVGSPHDWVLEIAQDPQVSPRARAPLASIPPSVIRTNRTRQVLDFTIDSSQLALLAAGQLGRLSVRHPSGYLGEIGRSLQDRIRGRVSQDRILRVPGRTYVPFADNNRLMVGVNDDDHSVTNFESRGDSLIFTLGSKVAGLMDAVGLYANDRHEPLPLTALDNASWRIDTSDVLDAFANGHPLLFLAGLAHGSTAIPMPLGGAAEIVTRDEPVAAPVQVVVANYGQVVLRPRESPPRQALTEAAALLRSERV